MSDKRYTTEQVKACADICGVQVETVRRYEKEYSFDVANPKVFKKKERDNLASMKQMGRGKSCGDCHNSKKAFNVKANCAKCHNDAKDILYKVEDPGNATFPHSTHLEMFGCDECHSDIFVPERNANQVGMKKMESGESCGACHDGDSAFSVKAACRSCHRGAEDIPIQSTVGAIVFSHDAHVDMFGCDECHPRLFQARRGANKVATMDDMEIGQSCGACHNGGKAFGVENCDPCHIK